MGYIYFHFYCIEDTECSNSVLTPTNFQFKKGNKYTMQYWTFKDPYYVYTNDNGNVVVLYNDFISKYFVDRNTYRNLIIDDLL